MGEHSRSMVYRFHDYTLDPASREVRHGAHRLALEPKVFQVLLYLLEHRDRMVPKAELLAQCWPETFVSESALTRCLARLRKAVQPTPTAPPVIETLHRQGYRFVAEVTVLAQTLPPTPVETALPSALPRSRRPHRLLAVASAPAPTSPRTPLPLPARPVRPGAERRQLTVLCCDVVDSTTLAGQLDPEDFREVMVRYHATCTAVIQRYGGHVAQYLGDGLLVYFGWPQAHEDDARRAVHAGLALVTAIRDLGTGRARTTGMRLALRIGIHTGLVVVGSRGGGRTVWPVGRGGDAHSGREDAGPGCARYGGDQRRHGCTWCRGISSVRPWGSTLLPGTTAPSIAVPGTWRERGARAPGRHPAAAAHAVCRAGGRTGGAPGAGGAGAAGAGAGRPPQWGGRHREIAPGAGGQNHPHGRWLYGHRIARVRRTRNTRPCIPSWSGCSAAVHVDGETPVPERARTPGGPPAAGPARPPGEPAAARRARCSLDLPAGALPGAAAHPATAAATHPRNAGGARLRARRAAAGAA